MIEFGKLLVDFGLVILVLIVQVVIYPSFKYFSNADLLKWHPIYTKRFSFIVMPLMLAQLAYSIYFVTVNQTIYTVGNLILVAIVWAITFVKAIPLHNNISNTGDRLSLTNNLIKWNLWRMILWCAIFLWTVFIMTF